MLKLLETLATANYNITSSAAIATFSANATITRLCRAYIILGGDSSNQLTGTAGTFSVTLKIGTKVIAGSPADLDLSTLKQYVFWTDDVVIPAGQTFSVWLDSPNADTSVEVKAYLYDSLPTYVPTSRPSGQATNIEDMIIQLWSRFFGKVVLDKDNNTLYTYDFADNAIATKQNVTVTVDNVETVDKAETP